MAISTLCCVVTIMSNTRCQKMSILWTLSLAFCYLKPMAAVDTCTLCVPICFRLLSCTVIKRYILISAKTRNPPFIPPFWIRVYEKSNVLIFMQNNYFCRFFPTAIKNVNNETQSLGDVWEKWTRLSLQAKVSQVCVDIVVGVAHHFSIVGCT